MQCTLKLYLLMYVWCTVCTFVWCTHVFQTLHAYSKLIPSATLHGSALHGLQELHLLDRAFRDIANITQFVISSFACHLFPIVRGSPPEAYSLFFIHTTGWPKTPAKKQLHITTIISWYYIQTLRDICLDYRICITHAIVVTQQSLAKLACEPFGV